MKKVRNNSNKGGFSNAVILILLTYFTNVCWGQDLKQYSGKYTYKSKFYYECLDLKDNGQYIYIQQYELFQDTIIGNWQNRSDAIILDSYPQRDKLLVYESRNDKIKGEAIRVYNKQQHPINYILIGITSLNDTITLRNQFGYSKVKSKLKAFYIIYSGGTVSPVYNIEGSRTNEFKVIFETRRVFENETWEIRDLQIIPKDSSGKNQNYFLKKE